MWLIRISAGEGLVQTHRGLRALGCGRCKGSDCCSPHWHHEAVTRPLSPFQFKANSYNETLMLHLFISISNLLNTVSTHVVPAVVGALGRAGCSASHGEMMGSRVM